MRAVSDAIRRSRAGLSDPARPIGSFLFLGPTGVGKTELCKALAAFMFDTEEAMVRIDMSEFMEKHSVARLIGAPPGYVGYEEGGYLTEAIRRRPYSVILLDEVEKAHPDVFNVLLQVLDDGRLTDGQGRTVDFRNAVIVMTSNLGSDVIQQRAGDGEANYAAMKDAVMEIVRHAFRPEFINRLDEIVVFHPLAADQIRAIARIQIQYLQKRLADRDMTLEVSDAALGHLGEAGFDPVYGARPLKRAIRAQLENPLAQEILAGKFGPGDRIEVGLRDGALSFEQVIEGELVDSQVGTRSGLMPGRPQAPGATGPPQPIRIIPQELRETAHGLTLIPVLGFGLPKPTNLEGFSMRHVILVASSVIGALIFGPLAPAKDLRDIELRRLFEPTPAEVQAEQQGRIYIYEGLKEEDIARAMREQFRRVDSMMFIRVQPTPVVPTPGQGGDPTPVYYQNDGC